MKDLSLIIIMFFLQFNLINAQGKTTSDFLEGEITFSNEDVNSDADKRKAESQKKIFNKPFEMPKEPSKIQKVKNLIADGITDGTVEVIIGEVVQAAGGKAVSIAYDLLDPSEIGNGVNEDMYNAQIKQLKKYDKSQAAKDAAIKVTAPNVKVAKKTKKNINDIRRGNRDRAHRVNKEVRSRSAETNERNSRQVDRRRQA